MYINRKKKVLTISVLCIYVNQSSLSMRPSCKVFVTTIGLMTSVLFQDDLPSEHLPSSCTSSGGAPAKSSQGTPWSPACRCSGQPPLCLPCKTWRGRLGCCSLNFPRHGPSPWIHHRPPRFGPALSRGLPDLWPRLVLVQYTNNPIALLLAHTNAGAKVQ